MTKIFKIFTIVVLSILPFSVFFQNPRALAEEFTASDFRLIDPVVVSGGYSIAADYQLWDVIGQQFSADISTTADFQLISGFLDYRFIKQPIASVWPGDEKIWAHWSITRGLPGISISGYDIGRSTISGGPYAYTSFGSSTVAEITGLSNGARYYFIVRAKDSFDSAVATSSEVFAIPAASVYAIQSKYFDINSASTTSLVNPNGTRVDVQLPAGLLSATSSIQTAFYSISRDSAITDMPIPSGTLAANTFYNFNFTDIDSQSAITFMDNPITLTFHYTDDDIAGIDESTLVPYRWDGSGWVALSGSSVDAALNTVTVSSQNFSAYSLIGSAQAGVSVQIAGVATGGGGIISYIAPQRALASAPQTVEEERVITPIISVLREAVRAISLPPISPTAIALPILQPEETAVQQITAPPVITEWPTTLESGNYIRVAGLASPNSIINVYVREGLSAPQSARVEVGPDGRFTYLYPTPVSSSYYTIYAKNAGALIGASDPVVIQGVLPLSASVGAIVLDYTSKITLLLAPAFLLGMMSIWRRYQLWMAKTRRRAIIASRDVTNTAKGLKQHVETIKARIAAPESGIGAIADVHSATQHLGTHVDNMEKYIAPNVEDIPD